MQTHFPAWQRRRILASLLLAVSLLTMGAPFAVAQTRYPGQNNSTVRSSATRKLVMVGGAALLYYLYRKHQASAAQSTPRSQRYNTNVNNGARANMNQPQLYRSKNGGIYYRDAQRRPVWLTVPSQGVQVPQSELQQYAPDYNRYRGNAPAAPRGYSTQPFSEFDSSVMPMTSPSGSRM